MIYLDAGATAFQKPIEVKRAVLGAMERCASPGRGGYTQAKAAAREVFACREAAAELFDCEPEQVVFTMNCTHGLNIAIRSLIKPGMAVAVSGFEHNAVMRPLYALGAKPVIFGRRLFDREDTLRDFGRLLPNVDAAVFTAVSNVFGYRLPIEAMAKLCRQAGKPFIIDAAQAAGSMRLSFRELGADFMAMPGHKGLLGPQGTGILLCKGTADPLLFGGTGTASKEKTMPEELPERLEAGTQNVPGIAGLNAGIRWVLARNPETIGQREAALGLELRRGLKRKGYRVFSGDNQTGVLSFLPGMDCEDYGEKMAARGIALRAGCHCAPLAHETAGTLDSGTARLSVGPFNNETEIRNALMLL